MVQFEEIKIVAYNGNVTMSTSEMYFETSSTIDMS